MNANDVSIVTMLDDDYIVEGSTIKTPHGEDLDTIIKCQAMLRLNT